MSTTGQRLDRFLWIARFFRTRPLAVTAILEGHVRINGVHAMKPGASINPGDVLTLQQGNAIRIVRVIAFAGRRGSASLAAELYEDVAR